jgi:DoxX-like family
MLNQQTFRPGDRFRASFARWRGSWTHRPFLALLTFGIAAIWLIFGVGFKVLGMVPRHRLIVASIIGESAAGPLTIMIGFGETCIALWVLSRRQSLLCAAFQTLAILTMNTLEIIYAKSLLLSPVLMVCANTVFLSVIWYWALNVRRQGS